MFKLFRGEFLFMGHKSFYIVEAETVEHAHEALCYKKEQDLKGAFEDVSDMTREDIAAQTFIEPQPLELEEVVITTKEQKFAVCRVGQVADEKGL